MINPHKVQNGCVQIITIRHILHGLVPEFVAAAVSAIGAGIQDRRKSPRFLVAITGPWLMFFAFMPQIHERYLIFAASIGCVLIAAGAGFMLAAVFLEVIPVSLSLPNADSSRVMLLVLSGYLLIQFFEHTRHCTEYR